MRHTCGEDAPNHGYARDEMTEELRRLLDAVAARAEDYLRGFGDAETAKVSDSCGGCPLCAIAAVLRGERTEATVRATEQVAELVRLLRQALTDHTTGTDAGEPATPEPERAEEDPPAPTGKVQHIDVRRVRGRVVRPHSAAAAE